MGTQFTEVYNRFLGKITDDMYMELTPEDTMRDLMSLLIDAIPKFEFPRKNLEDYTIDTLVKREDGVVEGDFVIGVVWNTPEEESETIPDVLIEHSSFTAELTSEEINILAYLMMCDWVQRQLTSIENIRMKYSGSDFKMTSQANHLAKLLSLSTDCKNKALHYQRLYKRRRPESTKGFESNWDVFRSGIYGKY